MNLWTKNFLRIRHLAKAYRDQRQKIYEWIDPRQNPLLLSMGMCLAALDRDALPKIKAELEIELAIFRMFAKRNWEAEEKNKPI